MNNKPKEERELENMINQFITCLGNPDKCEGCDCERQLLKDKIKQTHIPRSKLLEIVGEDMVEEGISTVHKVGVMEKGYNAAKAEIRTKIEDYANRNL